MAREEQNINQKELAEKIGISQSSLSNYEKGKRRLYIADLEKFAAALNKPTDYFMLPIDNDIKDEGNSEMIEFINIMNEIVKLSREDRISVFNYAKWLQQNKKE
jgi:transcriptional regulator with XRE-family HTH domain